MPVRMFASPESYQEAMGRWSLKLAPYFLDFAGVPKTGRIIDIGCGTGSLEQAHLKKFSTAQMTGVDEVEAFVEYCRAKFTEPRLRFELGNAHELAFPDESFDQALSLLVLMFVSNPDKVAREMRRVTKRGGTVAACTWDAEGHVMSGLFFEEAGCLDPSSQIRIAKSRKLTREGQLHELWARIGLRHVVETSIDIEMDFRSFDDYWTPLVEGDGPPKVYYSELAPHLRRELKERVRKRLLSENSDGSFVLPARALAVRGRVPG